MLSNALFIGTATLVWLLSGASPADAKGQPTACGAATLDEKNDDLIVVTASK